MTLRFAVLGSPIAHSRSPVMHEAAYRALGLPHVYTRIETSEAELPGRVDDLRRGVFAGLNVTVPHKARVLALVDDVDPSAAAVEAANTLVRTPDARVVAHNTDVPALVAEITRVGALRGERPLAGRTALVLGSGGAARAAVAALAKLGADRIVVRARAFGGSDEDELRRAPLVRAAGGTPVVTSALAPSASVERDVAAVVQATSCGMPGGPDGRMVAVALAWDALPDDVVALDVVYGARTPFLAAAEGRALRRDDGLGMLAAQGALAFSLWLGLPPPTTIMRDALVTASTSSG